MARPGKTTSTTSSTSASTPPPLAPVLTFDMSRVLSGGQLADSSIVRPLSFKGYIEAAAFVPHRIFSKEPKKNKDGSLYYLDPSYKLSLWTRFRIVDVYDPSDGSFDQETYEHYWSFGGKSLKYMFPTNDSVNPAGCDQATMKLIAAGKTGDLDPNDLDEHGYPKALVTLEGPDDDKQNLSEYHGRWFTWYDDTPESKRNKLEPKSSFVLMMNESGPAIETINPELVVTVEGKKNARDGSVLTTKLFALDLLAPDGYPYGAKIFEGMSGTWDTKKIQLPDLKDETTGLPSVQKVLFCSIYDGKVGETRAAAATTVQTAATTPATAAPVQTQAAVTPTAQQATPATSATSTASTASTANGPSDTDLIAKIRGLVAAALAPGQSMARPLLTKAVIVDSGAFNTKDGGEMMAAQVALNKFAESCPANPGDAIVAAMNSGQEEAFAYDPVTKTVTRVS